jgi:hypothetical protein
MDEVRMPTDEELAALLRQGQEELEAEADEERVEIVTITRRWLDDESYIILIDSDANDDAITTMLTKGLHQWVEGEWCEDDDEGEWAE